MNGSMGTQSVYAISHSPTDDNENIRIHSRLGGRASRAFQAAAAAAAMCVFTGGFGSEGIAGAVPVLSLLLCEVDGNRRCAGGPSENGS